MLADIIVYSSLAVFTLPMLWFIKKIATTNFLYIEEVGTWKNGINLTSLHGKPGDKINHIGYKLYVALCLVLLILVIDITSIWLYIEITKDTLTEQEEINLVIKYMIFLFIGLIIPFIMLYGSYKERYIERKSSIAPKSHKIVTRCCYIILVILIICLLPFL